MKTHYPKFAKTGGVQATRTMCGLTASQITEAQWANAYLADATCAKCQAILRKQS